MSSGIQLLEIPLNWDITQSDADDMLYDLLQKDLRNYFPNTIEDFFKSPHKWILVDFLREIQFLASSDIFSFAIDIFFTDPSLKEMYNLAKKHTTYSNDTGFNRMMGSKSSEKKAAFIQTSISVLNESINAITNGGYPFPKFIGKYSPAILFYFYEESTPIKYRGHIFIEETQLFTKKNDSLFFISIYKSNLSVARQTGFADYVLQAVQKKATQLNKEYLWTLPFPSMMRTLKEHSFISNATPNVNDINPLFIFWKKLNTDLTVSKRNPFFFWKRGGSKSKRMRHGSLKRKANKTKKASRL